MGTQQLAILDLNPPVLEGVPTLESIDITPRTVPNDGSTSSTMTVRSQDPAMAAVGVAALADGFPWSAFGGA